MKPVSDPTILQQLNQQTPGLKPVTDSDLLNQLEGKPAESWTDNIRDPIAGALKIGPTALKGVADLARLITGDRVGVDTSEAMQRGMKAIDEVIGSERLLAQKANINQALQDKSVGITDLPGVVVRNPRAALDATVSTVGSMLLPAGAAAGAVKALPVAATAATQLANVVPAAAKILPTIAAATPGAVATGASVVTGAAQNAAETFADTAGQDMADRYKGAGISGAASLILGKLLGGGAEGVVARRLAGETGARGALAMGKSAVQTGGKEFLQETGEESSNYVGKQVAKDEAIDPSTMGKQGLYGGMIGFGMGGASDVATNIGNVGKGGIERQIADAIDQAAQEVADRPTPQTVQQTVARIFDRMPTRPEPEPQPAPGPLALGFDPAVRNPDPVLVADDQGNVRPMSPDEQFAQQELIKRMQDMGLTPDVQRAIQQRQQSPEPAAPSTPQDLIQRLMGTGWQPTAISSQGITPNPDSELVGALGQDFERLFQGDVKDEIRARLASQPKTETQPKPAPAQGPAITDETADVSLTNEGKTPILQNRNRATQASISQMQSIAANPDYGRLGFSRDFANGAPVVAGGQIAPERLGKTDVAVASDGRRIPVQYAVVEAADVLTSNRADGTPNANYGNQGVQTIRAIAGNGRIAGLQAAYGQGTSQNYINELTADTLHGVNPAVIRGMRAPVLVRVMPQEAVTNDIGDVSNTTGNLNLSAVEQANNDAQRVNLEALQFGEDGGITAEAVRQFVRAMPQAEQGGLLDTNGQPTKQAVDRINAAVFAKAYGNDQLVRLFAQAQDPEARLILSALAQLAPKMARLEGAGALDLRDIVTQAAEVAVNARRNGVNLQRAAQQIDMTTDPLVGVVLDLFARNPRSNKPVVESLGNMADLAYTEATKPTEDMFGTVPRASRGDVINTLRPQDEQASQENLEQPAGREPVQVDAGRAEAEPAAAADPEPAQASGTTEAQPVNEDWMAELFGGQAQPAAPQAQPTKPTRDKARLASVLADAKREAEAARDDWDNRSYKTNKKQVNFEGDGPTRNESMSISAINEGRKRKTIEALTQEIKAIERMERMLADEKSAERLLDILDKTMEQAEADIAKGTAIIGKTPAEAFEYAILQRLEIKPAQGAYSSNKVSKALLAYLQGSPQTEAPGAPAEGLTSYTPQEIEQRLAKLEQAEKERQQQDREAEQRAQADAERDDFTLTGSDRAADVGAARGQQDIFSAPAEDTQEDAQDDAPKPTGKIEDLGEKIGGARKDLAGSVERRTRTKIKDERPAWARRFEVSQIAAGDSEGRWVMRDTRTKDWMGQPKIVGGSRNTYATEQEALDAVPLAAVSQKHRAVPTGTKGENGEYSYEIWRDINDRKRVKVVDQVFPSRVAAMEYMAKNAQAILETNTTFGEADLPRPDNTNRTGVARRDGDVEGSDFMETFGFRGVEFGNWNNQIERQEVMNAAYDGLMDLAEVMAIPPKAIGLNGDLALAFGARGQGLNSARAHYESSRAVINLTKMNGAGALAHEWLHALDHYFGRQDGKTPAEWKINKDGTRSFDAQGGERDMASGGFKRVNSGVRQELRDAYKNVMETMFSKAEQYVEDTAKADKFVAKSREDVARALDSLRKDLSEQKDVRYYKRNNKPASAEQLAEFDTVAKQIMDGEALELGLVKVEGSRTATGSRWSNEALEKLSAIYKAVRGRTGFDSTNQSGVMDRLRGDMTRYSQRLKMLADAQAGDQKTKRVPTEFAMNAKELDQGRGEDYWTTPHEMAARAFQGYVEDKIAAQGARSPFLNYAPENVGILTPWGAKRPYPYGQERKAINEAFDKFVGVLETRETDKGVMLFEPEAEYNAEAPKRKYTDDRQLQLFLDSEPDPSQSGPAVDRARREAVAAVDDLRSTESILAQALSGDYAARQRVSLVGQKVSSAEDLAVLAQVYRDPRFETFRVVFTNDSGAVVSQVGLTSRLPASTAAIMGTDLDGYLKDLSSTARSRGASQYYLLHNHPSGTATASRADQSLTQAFASRTFGTDLQFRGHVVIDTNEYSVINGKGESTLFKKDFGQSAPYQAQEWADVKINNPADVMAMAKRLQVDWDAVTLIHTDAQFNVKAISAIPSRVALSDPQALKKHVVKASLKTQGSQVFAVGRSTLALSRMNGLIVDGIFVQDDGRVRSMRNEGLISGGDPFPESRRTRVSPDTSPEFDYLRKLPEASAGQRAAENAPQYAPESLQGAADTWTVPEPGTFDNAVRAIQNNKIDLKRVRDAITERYGNVKTDADAYLNEELYHGKVAARVEALHKESVEPILAKIAVAGKNAGVTMDDVNLYLHARHAPERNAAMKAINPDMQNNEALSGMSDQEAAKVMRDFTAAGKDKALAVIARDVDQLLNDTRTGLVADGLEDAGVVQAWESAYKHYVPLQRDIGSSGTPKGMGFSVRGPESKRAVGSNKEVVNILANIVTQAETAAIRAEKATVGRSLLAMARQYPNPEFWKVDIAPTKPRINKDTGLVERNAVDPLYQTADNVIMVKDYGQEHFIVFNQKNDRAVAVAKAMKNLDIAPMNKILEVANKGTRFLASLLTQRNPLFWLTNFARDIQGAMLNLEGTDAEGLQREVMGNLPNAFKGMHALVRGEGKGQWARYANDMKEAGGTTGYMQAFENSDARMKDLEKEVAKMQQGKADPRRLARMTLEFVDDYNDIIENAVRLSVFQAARDNGVSTTKAASIAKNITVNFNRKGNLTPPINALYMFFNASVQGTARLAQAVLTSKTAAAAVGGIAIMGFLLDALNRAMSDDDEETGRNRYDLIPEFDKSKNWIIMNPMRPGEYVKVPLPLGPHVFHNAGRLLSDAVFRDDPRNAAEYGWSMAGVFLDAFSPLGAASSVGQLIAPSVLDPVLQVTENKSFTGAPVYKSADRFGKTDPKPAYTRYFESTPDVWKGASRMLNDVSGGDKDKPGAINLEPDILKHVFYTMTGGPGRTLDQTIDATQAGARGKDLTVNRVPLASRFYGANDDQQRERVYYDDRKRAMDAKTSFDHFMKVGRQDLAKEVAAELGDGDVTKGRRMMMEFSRAEKSVRKINGDIRKSLASEGDEEAQAEQLRALRKRRVRVMSDAVNDEE